MRNRLVGLGLGLALVFGVLFSQAVLACTTQTLMVGGKLMVCTICGTIVSCM
jgi:hypothetical protein